MRGHWLSQTRKLNRHYQSGGGNGETLWNPLAGCLCKVTKGGVDYYPAPSYCVLHNGLMLQEIFYNRVYQASGVSGIDISEEEVLEYVPYMPKRSDQYYINPGVSPLAVMWEAKTDFNVLQPDLNESIVSFSTGEDLSNKNANLLKLIYAGYVLKKSGTANITRQEYQAVFQALENSHGYAKIDGRGTYSGNAVPEYYIASMTGDFSAVSGTSVGINFMFDLVGNNGFYTYSQNIQAFKYPAMTVQPQYQVTSVWDGVQKVEAMNAPSITPYVTSDVGGYTSMHGFAAGTGGSTPTTLYDLAENARFCPIQILKRVEVVTCPITG